MGIDNIVSIQLIGVRKGIYNYSEISSMCYTGFVDLKKDEELLMYFINNKEEIVDNIADYILNELKIQKEEKEKYTEKIKKRSCTVSEFISMDLFREKQHAISCLAQESFACFLVEYLVKRKNIEKNTIEELSVLRYVSFEKLRTAMNYYLSNSNKLLPTDVIDTINYYVKSNWYLNCKVLEFAPKKLFKKGRIKVELTKPEIYKDLEKRLNNILASKSCFVVFLPFVPSPFDKKQPIVADFDYDKTRCSRPTDLWNPEYYESELKWIDEAWEYIPTIANKDKFILEKVDYAEKTVPSVSLESSSSPFRDIFFEDPDIYFLLRK